MTEGIKHDAGKLPWHLLPWDAVEQVVKVLAFGAQKYAERNWEKGIAHSRTFAATQRHLNAWFQEREDNDPETGINHLAHAACEVLFALAFCVRGRKDVDDRPQVKFVPATTAFTASTEGLPFYVPSDRPVMCCVCGKVNAPARFSSTDRWRCQVCLDSYAPSTPDRT